MRNGIVFLAVLLLINPAAATDFTKLDRTIAKEPQYQQTPKYLLAVFGKEAQSKVWIVFDGETIYVDTDGSGDLTAAVKRLAGPSSTYALNESQIVATYGPVTVLERDGKTRHELMVNVTRPKGAVQLMVRGPRVQYTGGIDDGSLTPAATPASAPVVHFGGPLVLMPGKRDWPDTALVVVTSLERQQHLPLHVKLGTPGLGQGTTACVNPATECFRPGAGEKLGPNGPLVDVTFYRKDGMGVPSLAKENLSLTCCAGIYTTSVLTPLHLAYDRARLTFTFPGSTPGLVESKTYDVDLVDARPTR